MTEMTEYERARLAELRRANDLKTRELELRDAARYPRGPRNVAQSFGDWWRAMRQWSQRNHY